MILVTGKGEGRGARRALVARGLAALITAAAATLTADPAAGAVYWPTFTEPTDLTPRDAQAFQPQVAVSGDGESVAVWRRATTQGSLLQAATRPPGGAWSAPTDLTPSDGTALDPHVAISAHGDAVAVWRRTTDGASVVQAAARPAGGAWSAPTDLTPTGGDSLDPQVAVSARGDAVVVWSRLTAGGSVVQAAILPAGGSWSEPSDLSSPAGSAYLPRMATGPDGDTVAVWNRFAAGRATVQVATRPAGGTWSSVADLTPADANSADPYVAVGSRGEAVAVWVRQVGSGSVAQAATRSAAGHWSAPADLSPTDADVSAALPRVALSADGDAVAAWVRLSRRNGSILQSVVQVTTRGTTGSWSAPTTLSGANAIASGVQVDVSPAGDALAVWRAIVPPGDSVVQAATRTAGGSWSAAMDLSRIAAGTAASSPDAAVGGNGDAVSVWRLSTPTGSVAQAVVGTASATPPYLDSHAPSGAQVPTYTTPEVLRAGVRYKVTVTGTYSLWVPSLMAVAPPPRWVVCGTHEERPFFPSVGVENGRTGGDAEFLFARPRRSPACSAEASSALPQARATVRFSVDGAARFDIVAPDGGVPSAPDAHHRYMYSVTGAGHPLTVAFADSFHQDNAGQLRVTVELAP
jgi:hypothetical protein